MVTNKKHKAKSSSKVWEVLKQKSLSNVNLVCKTSSPLARWQVEQTAPAPKPDKNKPLAKKVDNASGSGKKRSPSRERRPGRPPATPTAARTLS